VKRPFHYVETSLLNGRSFRTLERLNEVTRWWLANVADVRNHRTTKKRPLDAHAEALPHLLPLPEHDYDTARVVYRIVGVEGFINYAGNQYSAPWRLVGELLPVRVTDAELFIYDRHLWQRARHPRLAIANTECLVLSEGASARARSSFAAGVLSTTWFSAVSQLTRTDHRPPPEQRSFGINAVSNLISFQRGIRAVRRQIWSFPGKFLPVAPLKLIDLRRIPASWSRNCVICQLLRPGNPPCCHFGQGTGKH
jgi:hypothetical protein